MYLAREFDLDSLPMEVGLPTDTSLLYVSTSQSSNIIDKTYQLTKSIPGHIGILPFKNEFESEFVLASSSQPGFLQLIQESKVIKSIQFRNKVGEIQFGKLF